MLVLSRKESERVIITHPDGTRVVLTVVEVRHDGRVRLGFDAPGRVSVNREEIEVRKGEG